MMYVIKTGQFEKGTLEQQEAFIQLFGPENIQYKFDVYFHWYNIVHEYGHCLCDYYQSNTVGMKQELLVNRFAVSIWKYAGYEKELKDLRKMLEDILQKIKSPIPEEMSFIEFYEQIWGTEQMMSVWVYGYFQFEGVRMALEKMEEPDTVLKEMGIDTEIRYDTVRYKAYEISAVTAKEVLKDVQKILNDMGIEQPMTQIELVDDPFLQCANIV